MKQDMTWLVKLAHATYARWIIWRRKLSLVNSTGVDLSTGPFLLLSNHVGAYDPVIISCLFKDRNVRWVAGAYLFKMRFMRTIIGTHCKAIPKQQGRSDITTVRNMQQSLKDGNIVGIFPEGTRTWDGEMMPINYKPLAKMLKYFKVPVLFLSFEGGFAHQPRWCDVPRKGPVTVNIKHALTAEQIAEMPLDDLQERIKEDLAFSNDSWKNAKNYKYVCDKRAEGLQRLFYMCPSCHGVQTFTSKGDKITCSKCGAVAMLDKMDNITSVDIPFKRMSQWHEWERSQLSQIDGFEPEGGVLFQIGDADNDGKLRTVSENIQVGLANNTMTVKDLNDNSVHEFPLDKITSFVLNAKQTMELFCDDVLYRVRLLPDSSSLKYQEYYLEYIKQKGVEE